MKQAQKAMRVSEEENEQLKGIIDNIFGHESKLDREQFLDKLGDKSCSWIFTPQQIRFRMDFFLAPGALDTIEMDED